MDVDACGAHGDGDGVGRLDVMDLREVFIVLLDVSFFSFFLLDVDYFVGHFYPLLVYYPLFEHGRMDSGFYVKLATVGSLSRKVLLCLKAGGLRANLS